jgi:hypothetical protein
MRNLRWLVLVGGIVVVLGVLWQAFTIAAYVRGAGESALDAHGGGSLIVHIGQLAIVIGAVIGYWKNWWMVAGAFGFLVLSFAQLAFLGDTDEQGDWINGLHGFLAVVIALLGAWYANRAWRDLGLKRSGGVAGSA